LAVARRFFGGARQTSSDYDEASRNAPQKHSVVRARENGPNASDVCRFSCESRKPVNARSGKRHQ
jgi:hypothetical protein